MVRIRISVCTNVNYGGTDRVGQRAEFDFLGFYLPVSPFLFLPSRIESESVGGPAMVFRRFYACFSGPTGNLVELNNSARPINVTTRSAVSCRIRERGSGSGGTPDTLTFYFTVTCQRVYTHLRFGSRDPPRYTPGAVLCGLSRFFKLLPTISPTPSRDSFVNLKICQEFPAAANGFALP